MMHSNGKDLSMADTPGFTHITVSTDDDDDVVIQAGIADGPAEAEEGTEAADEAAEPAADAPEEAEPDADAEADADAVEPEAAPAPEPAAAPAEAPRAERDGYRETTLDDLAEGKMSTTQKAVIVVALLGIAAFVAWYLLAR